VRRPKGRQSSSVHNKTGDEAEPVTLHRGDWDVAEGGLDIAFDDEAAAAVGLFNAISDWRKL
jgi:hypothetical protein